MAVCKSLPCCMPAATATKSLISPSCSWSHSSLAALDVCVCLCVSVRGSVHVFLFASKECVIWNWPERIKNQPHDDRDNCFLPFDSKGPCSMTVNNDIDDDSATKHSDFHTRNSHRQSV